MTPLHPLLEPRPLKHRRLEDRGRRVRVVFEQFCRPAAAVAEIEPAIKAALVALPTVADQGPERFGYLQALQMPLVLDHVSAEFEAHRIDLAGWTFDCVFDFGQREGVKGALIPVAHAVIGMKIESARRGRGLPVFAFVAGEALHGYLALTAAMGMAVTMEVVRPAAETAIGRRAACRDRPLVEIADDFARTAVTSFDEAHRDGADGRAPHHGQDDAAGAFHDAALDGCFVAMWSGIKACVPIPGKGKANWCPTKR